MDFSNMDAGAMVDAVESVWSVVSNGFIWCLGLLLYIWLTASVWRLAKRRGIASPWLALFPVGNLWLLGSVADHYRSLRGESKTRRKALRLLGIVALALTVALVMILVCGTLDVIGRAPSVKVSAEMMEQMQDMTADEQSRFLMELMIRSVTSDAELVAYVQGCAVVAAVVAVCLVGVTLAGMVICRIAAYDVLCSCDPYTAKFMTVLCCAFPPALPVVISLVHDKDMGLPVTQGKKKK